MEAKAGSEKGSADHLGVRRGSEFDGQKRLQRALPPLFQTKPDARGHMLIGKGPEKAEP